MTYIVRHRILRGELKSSEGPIVTEHRELVAGDEFVPTKGLVEDGLGGTRLQTDEELAEAVAAMLRSGVIEEQS